MPLLKIVPFIALCALLGACSNGNNGTPNSALAYSAEIRRTDYGIPHIKADDWGGLGYGYGYAYAQDNFCITMREIVFSRSRSAELLGDNGGSADSDFLFRYLYGSKEEFQATFFDPLPDYVKELTAGMAAGMNRYLAETGVENLPEGDLGCRDASWVSEIDAVDLLMYQGRETFRGSSNQGTLRRAILDTAGPDAQVVARKIMPSAQQLAAIGPSLRQFAAEISPEVRGSNGIAMGRDVTQNGYGMLLGNPHQPWQRAGSWYQAHLTIPGVYDVAGASLTGYPFIGIGFNKDVAWTHTVSPANRFSLYELTLNPENPLQYDYDGEWRDIVPEDVEIQAMLSDGSLETRTHTFYTSQYGPIVNLKGVDSLFDGWPLFNGTSLIALRDANLTTGPRGIPLWITKGQATNLDEYIEALGIIGNPVFHDLAADRSGEAFYGEISSIPFITQSQLDDCVDGIGALLAAATSNVIVGLDGSRSECEWGTDPEAPEGSNLYGASSLPQLRTTNYVANSNNSYWLSNPEMPITGFPVIMGPVGHENLQQFSRTRIGLVMIRERIAGTDGFSAEPGFTLETLQQLMYSNRVYIAELVLDDVLTICDLLDPPADADETRAVQACAVLASWDRKANVDSRGVQVFNEFWRAVRSATKVGFQGVVDDQDFWDVDFTPADAVSTPAGIDLTLSTNHDLVIAALSQAVQRLEDANVALDAPWGEVQVAVKNSERIAIHGGSGDIGIYGAIGVGLSEGGYVNPGGGNSYIQTVTFDESDCPIADVILVPSNSTDPESPHFADQTRLYSNKEWVRFPFCEQEIEAAQVGETLEISEAK
ncbi:hypothetical protein EYC98_02860 [Halieaceae bacterium IMCC14734]|uniref:Acylase n=1 Tax=Candidatus Litorirhabdus singularis TaxID=2518993 RepID=A0ABT3TC99_9GAMM|nr:penicillin acylase family protein [Candidatus Litorirhabdus singularis]MCX2979800.1 hypothetical protein [Candidatus Litorirhabdus singularis]